MFFELPPIDIQSTSILEENICNFSTKTKMFFLPACQKYVIGIISFPPKEPVEKYSDLVCTQEDVNNIVDLITTLGSHGKVDLLLNHKKRLRHIEQKIAHVHPLKFMAVIFTRPQLATHMRTLHTNWFIWSNFINGFANNMNNEFANHRIYPFLQSFCKEIKCKEQDIKPYVYKKDWEGLLKFFIYKDF